ncbi:hypothetical protein AURDEDRAFT_128797 [Auricularia subglabra TFB-10046 SS5]|nr:hypothetical protein AURDEDRAFT_128797 [Auricularia subglabra TFB-10046 SS5]
MVRAVNADNAVLLDSISPFFLGGRPGALRQLKAGKLTTLPASCPALSNLTSLPASCPALSNLTSLRCTPSGDFSSIFFLCPHLEFLSLVWIQQDDAKALLPLSPPPSLVRLHLHTADYLCDIIALGRAWRTEHVRSISLQVPSASSGDPSLLLDGMCELSVRTGPVKGMLNPHSVAHVVALHPSGLSVRIDIPRITVRDGGEDISRFLVIYLKQSSFARMRRLTMAAGILYPFSENVRDLPALEELCLIVSQTPIGGHRAAYSFDWELLDSIADLPRFHISCVTIAVEYQPGEPPNAQEARELVARVTRIWTEDVPATERGITRFEITGFPSDVVQDSGIPQTHGISISFE